MIAKITTTRTTFKKRKAYGVPLQYAGLETIHEIQVNGQAVQLQETYLRSIKARLRRDYGVSAFECKIIVKREKNN